MCLNFQKKKESSPSDLWVGFCKFLKINPFSEKRVSYFEVLPVKSIFFGNEKIATVFQFLDPKPLYLHDHQHSRVHFSWIFFWWRLGPSILSAELRASPLFSLDWKYSNYLDNTKTNDSHMFFPTHMLTLHDRNALWIDPTWWENFLTAENRGYKFISLYLTII